MNKKREILEIINALLMVIDGKDHYTMSHSLQVMDYAQLIAGLMHLPKRQQEAIRIAGFLHDIGKIAIPDNILQKPGPLTAEEFTKMQTHPEEGAKILGQLTLFRDVLPMVLSHHERLDGSGYPEGLKNEAIPVGARILAIADTYSAVTADRPYRKAKSNSECRKILKEQQGKMDMDIVNLFLSVIDTKGLPAIIPPESFF